MDPCIYHEKRISALEEFPFATKNYLAELIDRFGWIVGDHTYGNPTVLDPEYGRLVVGRFCSIASGVTFVLGNHSLSGVTTYPFRSLFGFWPGAEHGTPDHLDKGGIRIGSDVWIGTNVTVLPGTEIGHGAVIAAGAIVRGHIPPFAIVAGNPAKIVKYRHSAKIISDMLAIAWWDWDDSKIKTEISSIVSGDIEKFISQHISVKKDSKPHQTKHSAYNAIMPCVEKWGTDFISDSDPGITIINDGIYTPYRPDKDWGIFEKTGRVATSAIDYRGPTNLLTDQRLHLSEDDKFSATQAAEDCYVYGGRINPHYGHFIINTLPRFWAMKKYRGKSTKILVHCQSSPEEWFKIPFLQKIFGALGLSEDDFVTPRVPTKISRLLIPQLALEEQRRGFSAFGDMCRALGSCFIDQNQVDSNPRPIYYSKSQLTQAVGYIKNEREIEEVMMDFGVEIIYPERLSFDEQVRLMSSRSNIIGTAGSFMHTSIFCPPRRITCLNVSKQINTNFTIIDALARNKATYHYPSNIDVVPSAPGVLTTRIFTDAHQVAKELLNIAGIQR